MNYSDTKDVSYLDFDQKEAKMVIEHTTDFWETTKSTGKKCIYAIGVMFLLYVFYQIWGIYFWLSFFVSIPFTFIIARKLVRVPIRWFLNIDITQPKFNLYGIPKSWSWKGQALPAEDNAGNQISVVRDFKINTAKHKVKTTMSTGDFDRLQYINDARVVEKIVQKLENTSSYLHYLQRNFWNAVIETIRDMQNTSIATSISDILKRKSVDLDRNPSVGKSKEKRMGDDYDEED